MNKNIALCASKPELSPSCFLHPAVILYDELIGKLSTTDLAKEIALRVDDLNIWVEVIQGFLSSGGGHVVGSWILREYGLRTMRVGYKS